MAFEFELVAAPALARGLGLLRARWGSRASWAAAAAVVVLACGARRVDGWLRALQPAAALDPSALPVRAAGFIRAHGLTGRHFNSFDDGGALEYLLPELPAYADSRIHAYPDAFYRRELAAERSPESFRAFLRAQGIEWAITLRSPTVFTGDKLLDGASDWALVYWDDLNEIFLRRDVPRFAPLIAALEYRHFRPDGAVFAEVARAPRAGLRAIDDELARFGERNPDDPYLALMRCEIAVRRGEPPEGPACAEAWSRAGSSERLRGLVALARQVPPLP